VVKEEREEDIANIENLIKSIESLVDATGDAKNIY
jgi:hypothetical protein